jgi:hypothetical protein
MMSVTRIITLVFLFLGGLGSILYGSLYHEAMVEVDKTREISIAIPTLTGFGESPSGHGGPSSGMPGGQPWGDDPAAGDVDPFRGGSQQPNAENPFENAAMMPSLPGIKYETVTETYAEAREEPEWAIVRDVTIGGIVRLANGQLKRTYSGKPPSLCPT